MGLDRNMVAVCLAEANISDGREVGDGKKWAGYIVALADDLLLALTPPVAGACPCEDARDDAEARKRIAAPVAPKSEEAKYEPRVGQIVRVWGSEWIVTGLNSAGLFDGRSPNPNEAASFHNVPAGALAYVRESTPTELAAAGLPSPEATRPTWVRVTALGDGHFDVTPGKVYEVAHWYADDDKTVSPEVIGDNGARVELACVTQRDAEIYPAWEPATPPAPVEPAKGEAKYAALVTATRNLLYAIGHAMGGGDIPVGAIPAKDIDAARDALEAARGGS